MPATLDDLARHLEQFFADRFPLDGADRPGSVLLVFDNLGRPLSPREFTGLLADQRAAELADQLPATNALKRGWYLPQSGSRLSRWYASVVQGSTPVAGADPDALASFEAAKAAAVASLELNEQVVVSGPADAVPGIGTHDTYYATSMSPVDWFAESATGWNSYQVGAADQPAPTPEPEPGSGGTAAEVPAAPVPTPEFGLLVATDPLVPELVAYVEYAVETEPQPDPLDDPAEPWIQAQWPGNRLIAAPARKVLPYEMELVSYEEAVPPAADAVIASTTPTRATSRGFAVKFEYCLVRLDRPWWDDIFLSRQDWRLPGYRPGQISDGSLTGDGKVAAITVGMLVIRNLTITASWSEADLAALPDSTSLGPFCIAAGSFDAAAGTLSRTGPQAVAWLVQVPSVLPPQETKE